MFLVGTILASMHDNQSIGFSLQLIGHTYFLENRIWSGYLPICIAVHKFLNVQRASALDLAIPIRHYCRHKFPARDGRRFRCGKGGSSKRYRERGGGKNVIVGGMAGRNHILFHWAPGARYVAMRHPRWAHLRPFLGECFPEFRSYPFLFRKTTRFLEGGCS
ncbi:hypothetical protein CEXT_328651 [Caerostris extrusa]|uniref:Uncharacterized protein n=1 Tax=Caerostris extrusa TaxID=172846 RepID=A0AAV4S4E3_CAEEX|nr:hypothetical protein CEXT_328651 [Caerostris extrusa]